MKPCSVRNVILALTVLLLALPLHAVAQEMSTNASFGSDSKEPIPVNVLVGQSRLLTFDRPIERFSVSNPEIAEAVLVSSNQVVVNGKGFGQINFIAWEKGSSRFVVFDVYVRTNLSLIDSQIRALFPKDDIRLSQANGSVVLSGSVSDPKIATSAEAVVQAAGFKTVNLLESPVKNAMQVQLQVRVAEISRNKMRELGTSYAFQSSAGTGGYLNSGAGPSSLGNVDAGFLTGTIANTLEPVCDGRKLAGLYSCAATAGCVTRAGRAELDRDEWAGSSFPRGWRVSRSRSPGERRTQQRNDHLQGIRCSSQLQTDDHR